MEECEGESLRLASAAASHRPVSRSAKIAVNEFERKRAWDGNRDRADDMAIAKLDSFNLKPTTTRKQNEVKWFRSALKQQSLLDTNVPKNYSSARTRRPWAFLDLSTSMGSS